MSKNIVKRVIGTTMLCSMLTYYTVPTFAYTNEEMVYSKSDVNGKNYKTIVSQTVEDKEGTKNNQIESQKQLPIDMEVKYKLDGKEMSAEEIAGKKGKVTITIKYTNKDEKQVNINGTTEKMYTPFLVVSGLILENDYNKNVEINHGKVINNGNKTIVAGFAIPGLLDSLKLEDSNIDVNDTVEITMDTDKFEIGNIMTYATPKVFSSLNIKMSDFNSLFNKVTDLQNATNKLVDGATALNNGIILFDEGVDTLKDGSAKLDAGVGTLQTGVNSLNSGAEELKKGTSQYSTQSKKFNSAVGQVANGLNDNYSKIDNGIKNVSKSLNSATEGTKNLVKGIGDTEEGLDKIIKSVDDSIEKQKNDKEIQSKLAKMNELMNQNNKTVETLKDTNTKLDAQLKLATDDNVKAQLKVQIKSNNDLIKLLKENNQAINGSVQTMNEISEEISTKMTTLSGNLKKIKEKGIGAISKGASDLKDGLNTLNDKTSDFVEVSKKVKDGMKDKTEQLSSASNQLTSATNDIANGASKLSSGTQELVNGTNTLKNGTADLSAGVNTLSTASKALVQGSTQLKEGIEKYKKEGIDNIVDLVNTKGKNLIRRIEKLEELSENYNTFEDETKKRDEVAFINVMDSISADSNKKDDNDKK